MNDVIDKIKKLFALSRNAGATQAEAENALNRAQELMKKHHIEMSRVEHEHKEKQIVESSRTKLQRLTIGRKCAVSCVKKAIPVEDIYNGKEMFFVGNKIDVEYAMVAYNFLVFTFENIWKAHKSAHWTKDKISFYLGMRDGFVDALCKARKENDSSGEYGLIIVNKAQAVAEFIKDMPNRKTSYHEINYGSDYYAGVEEGRNIKLQKAINERERTEIR